MNIYTCKTLYCAANSYGVLVAETLDSSYGGCVAKILNVRKRHDPSASECNLFDHGLCLLSFEVNNVQTVRGSCSMPEVKRAD